MARKPRDYDAELQALMDKAKKVKTQKTTQLGELVQVIGADSLPIEALAGALLAARRAVQEDSPKPSRGGPSGARRSFSKAASGGPRQQPATLLAELRATTARLRRLTVLRNRLDRDRARDDKREWVQDRRARTRHLIELGGLVQKAGLVELVDDDRATLLGAFLELADRLQEDRQPDELSDADQDKDALDNVNPADLKSRWRRRGLRAFEADRDDAAA